MKEANFLGLFLMVFMSFMPFFMYSEGSFDPFKAILRKWRLQKAKRLLLRKKRIEERLMKCWEIDMRKLRR